MSNALAIATVTTALAHLIENAAQSMVDGVDVLTSRPDMSSAPAHRIHLFLYQVTPNAAMRNNDLHMRRSDGKVVTRPAIALDLHYLLAFYGDEIRLEPQRMLGAVVRDLHARPVLTRQMIRDGIAGQSSFLAGSNLSEAVEQVRITALPLSLEEMSKIWSVFFQTPYALSLCYQTTAVLIDSEESTRPSLPVLKRGEYDQGVDVLLGPFPQIESAYFGLAADNIMQARPESLPAAQLGLSVIVAGRNLGGTNALLRFHHSRLGLTRELPVALEDISPQELKVQLPQPDTGTSQTDWASGVYTVTVVQKQGGSERELTSNGLPVALSPIIGAIEPGLTITRNTTGTATITLTCRPRIRPEQQVVLVVAGREIIGEIDGNDSDKVVFIVKDAPTLSNELIRLRVDGIESMPFNRVETPLPTRFEFDPNQRLTII